MIDLNKTTTSDYLDFDVALNKSLKIIKTGKNYKLGFLVLYGINTGLRISDILQLKAEDLENEYISLIETKTKKKRIIKVNDNIKNAYRLLKERQPSITGPIFTSNQNTTLSTQYINRKIKEEFGSKKLAISTHSMRKGFGRRVWENDNKSERALLYLSELFNHTSPSITRKYLGIRQNELDDIYMSL